MSTYDPMPALIERYMVAHPEASRWPHVVAERYGGPWRLPPASWRLTKGRLQALWFDAGLAAVRLDFGDGLLDEFDVRDLLQERLP